MRQTVRTVLKTQMGIIAVRDRGQTQWGFIETPMVDGDKSWERAAIRGLFESTGISAPLSSVRRIVSKINHSGGSQKRYEVIYCEITLPDIRVVSEIRSTGINGKQVEEVTFWKARNGKCLKKEMRDFLNKHNLIPQQ